MDIIRWAINKPVSVTVAVILVVMFGLIGLGSIPIQLTPTVDRPIITVTTNWPGRSPQEIVDEITREQEKLLKNVTNIKSLKSTSAEGTSTVTIEFYVGANINRALQEVSDKLRQVPAYPDEVDEPVIKAAEGSAQNAIAWIIVDLDPELAKNLPNKGEGFDIATLFDPMDREVKPYLERIDGVAEVNIYGGREREARVMLDARALAARTLSHQDIITALRGENRNISAGSIAEGKRNYIVRVVGQYATAQDVLDTIVAYRDGKPVYVRDVGDVEIGYERKRGFVRSLGNSCLAMNIIRQGGSNVVQIMADVRDRLEVVKKEMFPRMDPDVGSALRLRQVYDETTYISSSIDLVVENLWVGGLLSVFVLMVFLRSVKATLVISLAIPICIIGTFLVMLAAGRTLNVISLAGLAFSTGVVVDNAIVVLENIERRRALGDPPLGAVYRGAKEVWGAITAGTFCHVAVFLPILTIQDEAGQIFFDLTLALSVSIILSLIVAITVIPAAQGVLARFEMLRGVKPPTPVNSATGKQRLRFSNLFGLAILFSGLTRQFSHLIYWCMTDWRGWTIRPAIVILMLAGSVLLSMKLVPPMDYLPAGNQNLVFGGLLVPPGLSVEEQLSYANRIEERVGPYSLADINKPETVAALPPIPRFDSSGKMFDPVPVENFFIGGFGGNMFVGAISQDPQRVIPVGNLLTMNMNGMPDAMGFAAQSSIFGSQGAGGGNSIDLEISGPSLLRVVDAAKAIFGQMAMAGTFGNVQPNPANFNLTLPETRIRLNRSGRQLGLRTEDLGVAARGLVDGAFAGDFNYESRNIDMLVLPSGGKMEFKESLGDIPVLTPGGRIVPLGSVADITSATAPQEIQRIEELPSVTIQVTPPKDRPLESVMDDIRNQVIAPATASGLIDSSMRVRLEGTAAKLSDVKESLLGKPPSGAPKSTWQTWLQYFSVGIAAMGCVVAAFAILRAITSRRGTFVYAALGSLLLASIIGGMFFQVAQQPEYVMARMVWTLVVTYLLMCALFESFLYPFVIMFSVPPGIVGGFAALRLVNEWTLRHPTINPQQLDVLTMIGFVILIG
ncbi:MAG: efflux RND transporter permease subunit, partial [Pyrinomonadaceae bacterium]|nr:efflux RND transporter permease subunit [Phycisphaerales bacterium]